MDLLAPAHLAITAAYCGLLWVVQVVVYPQFQRVAASGFRDYHRNHCVRMGWVVAPLFVAEGITAFALASALWATQPVLQTASVGLFLISHVITFAIFVPLHRQLECGPVTKEDLQLAVRLNWLRVTAATVRVGVVGVILITL